MSNARKAAADAAARHRAERKRHLAHGRFLPKSRQSNNDPAEKAFPDSKYPPKKKA